MGNRRPFRLTCPFQGLMWMPPHKFCTLQNLRLHSGWCLLLAGCKPFELQQTENILECHCWDSGVGLGRGVPGATGYNMVAKRTKLSRQRETFGTGHLWIKKQKPKTTNAIVYLCLRSVGRNLERRIPNFPWHWFMLIWDHASGFLQYFPLTEENFWNTARLKNHSKNKAKPWSI